MRLVVTEEGIQELKRLAGQIEELTEEIHSAEQSLLAASEASGLGPHQASISSVIQDVGQQNIRAKEAVKVLADSLDQCARKYQDIIDYNRWKQSQGN